MASFRVETQRQGTELVGGTLIRDVIVVGAWTIPSNVYFEVAIPRAEYDKTHVLAGAEIVAERIEAIIPIPHVAGVAFTQDVTPSGQVANIYEITVVSSSGKSSMQIQSQLTLFDLALQQQVIEQEVNAAVAVLDSVEEI